MNEQTNERVFNQNCSDYLESLEIQVEDGVGHNAPYRKDSDSESFYTDGPLFCDHATGKGGNVWDLAVLMNDGNRHEAYESLHAAAGIPVRRESEHCQELSERGKAEDALQKVRDHFGISEERTPPEVIKYLKSRKITEKTWGQYLAYIPEGDLGDVLSGEEIGLTGLEHREGQLILWYLRNGKPVYYCTRGLKEKQFRKASTDILEHPIWNVDVLRSARQVVWAEGFFDCLSLAELGYAVAGEITCNLIKAHKPELLNVLRWRGKHLSDSEFIICLDNDTPDATGVGAGNRAAAKIAGWLWAEGIDEKWVKHDPAAQKVDVNDLHQQGREADIHRMIQSAEPLSNIFGSDVAQSRTNFLTSLAEGDLQTAKKMLEVIQAAEQKSNKQGLGAIAKSCLQLRLPYERFYRDVKLFLHGDSVYAFYPKGRYGQGQKLYDVYTRSTAVDNLRPFQRNPAMDVKWGMLDVPAKRPVWRVSNALFHETRAEFNLFQPSWMLMQDPVANAKLPDQWELVLNNLAGTPEREWFLNHMATYVQTLGKPRTVPVLVGRQGTGKNSLIELFGKGIGGFSAVGRGELESGFNSYLRSPVILLDELSSSNSDANNIKNKLKALVNESAYVNEKYEKEVMVELNNYIAIASNEQLSSVPVIVEDSDRRYTFITGGRDMNLANNPNFDHAKLREQLPDFMLYLLSREIASEAANVPLMNTAKRQFQLMGEDPVVAAFKEWVAGHRSNDLNNSVKVSVILKMIREDYGIRGTISAAKAGQILKNIGEKEGKRDNQNHCFGVGILESSGQAKAITGKVAIGSDQDIADEVARVTGAKAPVRPSSEGLDSHHFSQNRVVDSRKKAISAPNSSEKELPPGFVE